jgi:mannosyltransferase
MLSGMICGRSNVIVSTSKKSAIYAPFTTTIIPHGVHILPCETRSIQNNTVKIAIIGRIRPEKGIDIFVDALLNIKHHNFHAYIIGLTQKKYEAFKEKITKKIYQHGANDHFTWTEMAHGDLVTFLRTVDIVVACPRYEGFGLTLFEAAAAGCAIIGSNTGAFADLIGDGHDRGILIHCGDVQALQDAIERLLMDPQMMINLGVKAQKYVQENFSIHHEAMSLLKVYQKAIE